MKRVIGSLLLCAVSVVFAVTQTAAVSGQDVARAAGDTRTPQVVMDLIRQVGGTLPEWWDSVELTYPKTLNLRWRKVRDDWAPDHNLVVHNT